MCGRFDDMTKDISTFLQRIPAIDRCSSVVGDGGPLFEIHKALVDVYKDLLQFYLKTVPLFEKRKFALGVALEMLRPQVADIISSFKAHAELLSSLLEFENFASIQEIKDDRVDALGELCLPAHQNPWTTASAVPLTHTTSSPSSRPQPGLPWILLF